MKVQACRIKEIPKVKDYISKRMEKISNSKIPKQQEVLEFLGAVMRGTVSTKVVVDGKKITLDPPDIKSRLIAAKELLRRYPNADPLLKAQLKKLNAEAELAEQQTNESQDSASQLSKSLKNIDSDRLKALADGIMKGGDN